jgi:hypothetical protein
MQNAAADSSPPSAAAAEPRLYAAHDAAPANARVNSRLGICP